MKKFILSAAAVAGIWAATTAPVFANVVHANGSTGVPSAVGSNSGSVQGQTNRSTTGTTMKFTNDGWAVLV
ncbi:hypothetical protein [Alicyclobacillus acidiphilus]|uniref:hypothetical protein n=1 Tax=Alicyclobacillus acidiphilus TaxID=182455 RepID=UPI0008350BF0|nr:hypothetical protein [Alicyclobacillus acidiphilus]